MKAAVLGVGRMGRRHIEVVRRAGLELAAVFDVDKQSLQLAREEHSLDAGLLFSDRDAMYSEARPACVIVATTADSHCELVCEAAERGATHILVEKPMAVSLKQCDLMLETCARHGAKLAVNHQMRFMEQYIEPKRLLATAGFGGLGSMNVVAGNFGFSMNGTHYFEAFHFLTDEDVAEVRAWFSPGIVANPRGARFEDRAGSIRAVTRSGRRLYMEIGSDQGHGVLATYAGRNGFITVNELTGEMAASEREAQYRELPTTRYGMPAVTKRATIQPAEVIDTSAAVLKALLSGVNSVTGEDGARVVALLVAAYQSAEHGGTPVKPDACLDADRVFPWA